MSTQDTPSSADEFLEALEADVPVFVAADVSLGQVVKALRAAGLSMRLEEDPFKRCGLKIIVSRGQGQHRVN